jgi:hypothetical protein
MKQENKLGFILASIGALLGIFGTFILFTHWYDPMMVAEIEAGRPDEELIVMFIIPFLSDLGIIAGVLWAVAAYGFWSDTRWAWPVAVVASVLALQGSFFPMIPAASRDLPPAFGMIFVPSLIIYVVLLLVVGKVERKIFFFSLFAGIAFVLSFMNGVASTDRILVTFDADNTEQVSVSEDVDSEEQVAVSEEEEGEEILVNEEYHPLYVAVQRLNWLASIGWGVFTIWLIVKPREWVRVVGLAAGLLEVVVGIPLGLATMIEFGHFSMFFPAPVLSLILIVILMSPWGRGLFPDDEVEDSPAS